MILVAQSGHHEKKVSVEPWHISMEFILGGIPRNNCFITFMQFSTKIDGFEQKDSQGFENSYNSYEQYPLEKILIFTIYQNYTLAVTGVLIEKLKLLFH